MSEFRRLRKGGVYVTLPPQAAGVLVNLTRQLVELLRDGEARTSDDPLEAMVAIDGPRDVPEDPALMRLLPDARRDDPEAASEFRRLTERSLRDGKVRDAVVVLGSLSGIEDTPDPDSGDLEFELDREQVRSWLRCLTDLRLTLAARLGISSDDDAYWDSLDADDERVPVYEIYQWLNHLLGSMLDVVPS